MFSADIIIVRAKVVLMCWVYNNTIYPLYGQRGPECVVWRLAQGRMAAAGTIFMVSDGQYPCRELGLMQPGVHTAAVVSQFVKYAAHC